MGRDAGCAHPSVLGGPLRAQCALRWGHQRTIVDSTPLTGKGMDPLRGPSIMVPVKGVPVGRDAGCAHPSALGGPLRAQCALRWGYQRTGPHPNFLDHQEGVMDAVQG